MRKYILGPDKVLQLSDIVCITKNKKLYKAKIENVEIRRFGVFLVTDMQILPPPPPLKRASPSFWSILLRNVLKLLKYLFSDF